MSSKQSVQPEVEPVVTVDQAKQQIEATTPGKPGLSVVKTSVQEAAVETEQMPVINPVHEGSDDWLFLVAGSNSVIDLYSENSSFTPELAQQWVDLLRQRSSRFQEQGIQYLHISAPEKLTVLHKHFLD